MDTETMIGAEAARVAESTLPGRGPARATWSDYLVLAGSGLLSWLRSPGTWSAEAVVTRWLHRLLEREGSAAVLLAVPGWRLLVIGHAELSREVLDAAPSPGNYCAGELKRAAIAPLAPRALTIADGDAWVRLRAFHEDVLETGRAHHQRAAFLSAVQDAFRRAPRTPAEVRGCMAAATLRIVLGESAPPRLAADVQTLFERGRYPFPRPFVRSRAGRERARFRSDLERAWSDSRGARARTLLGAAKARRGTMMEAEVLDQVPQWLFGFTGSAADLLIRTLALIGARPAVRRRVLQEVRAAGPQPGPDDVLRLDHLRACLRETGRLFPPVSSTFHRAPAGASLAGFQVGPDLEIVHCLPLLHRFAYGDTAAHDFKPERWLAAAAGPGPRGDAFLSGARACPGQDLALLVCTAAAASLLRRGLHVDSEILARDPLPLSFPRTRLRFRYDGDQP